LTTFLIFLAALNGDVVVIQLLDHGADPNLRNNNPGFNGRTPLDEAALADTEGAAIALLNAGASFSVHQKTTEDNLWRVITSGWTTFLREAFRALEARSETFIASDTFFIAAAHLGDSQLMETFLASRTINVNVNYQLISPSGLPQGRTRWERQFDMVEKMPSTG
jgi:ankyrin repeat protein